MCRISVPKKYFPLSVAWVQNFCPVKKGLKGIFKELARKLYFFINLSNTRNIKSKICKK